MKPSKPDPTDKDPFLLPSREFEPAYLELYRSGELEARVEQALEELCDCRLCPRDCGVDRLGDEKAVCGIGRYAHVSSFFAHLGEEDCLRGWRGSGTIFFSMCNLRCVFCQNYDVSQVGPGEEARPERLAAMMLNLQSQDCHNINFVTPEHVVPQILEALLLAIEGGLRLPLVYNTSAYDSLESLRLMDGVVDIYMPDFKFWDEQAALLYLKAKNYPQTARVVIREMHRQVGPLMMDEQGIAKRGVLLRHLVMPAELAGSEHIMRFLATELSKDTYVNVMTQYRPAGKVVAGKFKDRYRDVNRSISPEEYENVLETARAAGLWRFDERR